MTNLAPPNSQLIIHVVDHVLAHITSPSCLNTQSNPAFPIHSHSTNPARRSRPTSSCAARLNLRHHIRSFSATRERNNVVTVDVFSTPRTKSGASRWCRHGWNRPKRRSPCYPAHQWLQAPVPAGVVHDIHALVILVMS